MTASYLVLCEDATGDVVGDGWYPDAVPPTPPAGHTYRAASPVLRSRRVEDPWDRWDGASFVPAESDLATYQTARILALASEATIYVGAYYPPARVASLQMLFATATADGLINRAAHIRAALDWGTAVMEEYRARRGDVLAAPDKAGVDAVAYGWPAWLAANPNPGVTVTTALAIPD